MTKPATNPSCGVIVAVRGSVVAMRFESGLPAIHALLRASKNIETLLDTLTGSFRRLRQDSIDGERFDVVTGFEALNHPSPHGHVAR